MRRVPSPAALATLVFGLLAPGASAGTLAPELAARVATLAPGERVPVVAHLATRVEPRAYRAGRASAPALVAALRATAAATQPAVLAFLAERGIEQGVRRLWIDNSLAFSADAATLAALAERGDVASVEFDEPVRFDGRAADPFSAAIAGWDQTLIRTPDLWAIGLDGQGVVVGSMDTGFDPAHPALAGKWRGGTNSWTDIINGLTSPYDDHGHGTHTIGTMVGGDGPGPSADDIGTAHGATFISAKVLDATNSFSSASIVIAGAQFMLDPDGDPGTDDFPDVVNNSWGFFSATYAGFRATVEAWHAAGILPVFSIGNNGPAATTTGPPGNYDNTLGVGAVDAADLIASFSSRGPAPVGVAFPADQRKPDLSAPGSAVVSSVPGGGYQAWYGTSMAAPHVAGALALMKQANPGLTYALARASLLNSVVDRGAAGYDDAYGYGRLDAYAAVVAAAADVPGAAPAAARFTVAPNPARGSVRFAVAGVPADGGALEVFDLTGRRVWSGRASGAATTLTWDARDTAGGRAPAGLYLARLTTPAGVWSRRLVMLP